jgi:hypothetical protein
MDMIEEIKKLKALFDEGAISEEEFSMLKKKIMSQELNSNAAQKRFAVSSQIDPDKINSQTSKKSPIIMESSTPALIPEEMSLRTSDEHENFQSRPGNQSSNARSSIKKNAGREGYQEVTVFNRLLGLLAGLILGFPLSIVLWYRYDNFLIFIVILTLAILLPIVIIKRTLLVSTRNLYLGLVNVIFIILLLIPVGNTNNVSSSSSEQSTESSIDEEGQHIREFLLDHIFIDNVNCNACYVRFTSDRGGWQGKATLATERVGADYIYVLNGRTIELTPVLSAFNGTSEGKFTMTFSSDNTISAYIAGQEFIFKPN